MKMENCKSFNRKITVVSFDVDGTLINYDFVNSVWFEEIPKLVAEKEGISFNEALKKVKAMYNEVTEEKIEWYDIKYWISKFELKTDWKEILEKVKWKIKVYPDVIPTLEKLSKKYTLIINSNSPREFLDLELKETGLTRFFFKIFSSTSDFNQVRKSEDYYKKICFILNVKPENMLHIGDNWKFDFEIPSKIGINALFLDRGKKFKNEKFIIHELTQIESLLKT
ncbi:MAG: HAD family hydrolase [Candidatus Bathyarchaeia archaeon]|nr:HAD family hydrolase [Candidatus Bathyarchaeota archaeon]